MGRLPATDASGQVGLRRNLAEVEPAEGPMKRAERKRERERVGRSHGAESRAEAQGTGLQACSMHLSPVVMRKTHEAYSSFPPIRY